MLFVLRVIRLHLEQHIFDLNSIFFKFYIVFTVPPEREMIAFARFFNFVSIINYWLEKVKKIQNLMREKVPGGFYYRKKKQQVV